TETIPLRLEDTPSHLTFPGRDGIAVYGESVYVGYRHYDTLDLPVAYPFGHGLTYGSFAYDRLIVHETGPNSFRVTVRLTNTGSRETAEVAQLYVRSTADGRPVHELRDYCRVELGPGRSRTL